MVVELQAGVLRFGVPWSSAMRYSARSPKSLSLEYLKLSLNAVIIRGVTENF